MIFNLMDAIAAPPAPPAPTELVLYDAGDEKSAASGGWAAFAPAWVGSTAVMLKVNGAWESGASGRTNPVGCSKNAGSLSIAFKLPNSQDAWANSAFGTGRSLDLTAWSTLHVRATAATSKGGSGRHYCVCGVTGSKAATGNDTPPGSYAALGVGDNTLDVSAIDGGYVYFGGQCRGTAGTTMDKYVDITVTKIWLT